MPSSGQSQYYVTVGRERHRSRVRTGGRSLEEAALAGLISRTKIEGIWLYARDQAVIERAQETVLNKALEVCSAWFLASLPPLAGKLSKDLGSLISPEACRPLLRSFVRREKFCSISALTRQYEPHPLVCHPNDAAGLDLVLSQARGRMEVAGRVTASELVDPGRSVSAQAWRYLVLSHLEWANEGSHDNGVLTTWSSL
jgi:hypothetical protein